VRRIAKRRQEVCRDVPPVPLAYAGLRLQEPLARHASATGKGASRPASTAPT
jgi:hypothetical protein